MKQSSLQISRFTEVCTPGLVEVSGVEEGGSAINVGSQEGGRGGLEHKPPISVGRISVNPMENFRM